MGYFTDVVADDDALIPGEGLAAEVVKQPTSTSNGD